MELNMLKTNHMLAKKRENRSKINKDFWNLIPCNVNLVGLLRKKLSLCIRKIGLS